MLLFHMLLAATNKGKRLLLLSFIGQVTVAELQQSHTEVLELLAELPTGFRLLTDLSHLQSMELGCEAEIARVMEFLGQKGLGWAVRVIPDPQKDIGFNILTAFHYPPSQVRVSTCQSMEEATRLLAAPSVPESTDATLRAAA
ncbi:MAG TPA: hypothetical protein VNZ22_20055 [Bacillota bacterium]|nr:hypothetical protein [Bacillota bacterium]